MLINGIMALGLQKTSAYGAKKSVFPSSQQRYQRGNIGSPIFGNCTNSQAQSLVIVRVIVIMNFCLLYDSICMAGELK